MCRAERPESGEGLWLTLVMKKLPRLQWLLQAINMPVVLCPFHVIRMIHCSLSGCTCFRFGAQRSLTFCISACVAGGEKLLLNVTFLCLCLYGTLSAGSGKTSFYAALLSGVWSVPLSAHVPPTDTQCSIWGSVSLHIALLCDSSAFRFKFFIHQVLQGKRLKRQ